MAGPDNQSSETLADFPTPREAGGAKVFVSYSRADLAFASQLVTDLIARGFQAYLDKKDILPGEPWQERLGALIAGADTVVFLISPDSVTSTHCGWEADEAVRLSKRILPVVYRSVSNDEVPGHMKRLNYVFMQDVDDRAAALDMLATAIKVDIKWIREHTRIGEAAAQWTDPLTGGDDALLRGREISDAERWISSRPTEAPEPTKLHRTFIQTSREAETARTDAEKRQIVRTRQFQKRASWALAGVGALLVAGLAGVIRQDIETTKREQAVFTSKAEEAIRSQHYDSAIRLALQAYPPKGSLPWTPLSSALEAKLAGGSQMTRLRLTLLGHSKPVTSSAFSPDGSRLVTASEDATARLWNAETGKEIAVLKGHGEIDPLQGAAAEATRESLSPIVKRLMKMANDVLKVHRSGVTCTVFSPDGKLIVTTSDDNTARLWDGQTGKEISVLKGHEGAVTSASFDPSGTRIVTASEDKTARVWDAKLGSQIAMLKGHQDAVLRATFSPDGKYVATASQDNTARIWDADGSRLIVVLAGHKERVLDISYSPDGSRIVTASLDRTARIWDPQTGKEVFLLAGHEGFVGTATFSADGQRVVTSSQDKTARIWDLSSRKLVTLKGHVSELTSALFSRDGKRVVTASKDHTAILWEADTGQEIAILKGHLGAVNAAAFSPNGTRVMTTSDDGSARVWSVTGQLIGSMLGHEKPVLSAIYSIDGKRIVTTSADGTARLWDAEAATELAVLRGHYDRVRSASFHPNGNNLITASDDGTVRMWDALTGRQMAILVLQRSEINGATFNPAGNQFVTASDDKTARIYSLESREQLFVLKHKGRVNSAVFSPDGTLVLSASSDQRAQLWRADTGEYIGPFAGHADNVIDAEFSRDGTRIVTSSFDGTARLWDAETRREILSFKGDHFQLFHAAFSPDGMRVLTSSMRGTSTLWDVPTGQEIAKLKTHEQSQYPINDATFSPDGNKVLTTAEDGVRVWNIKWVETHGPALRDRVCSEMLFGDQEFTTEELDDSMLSNIDKNERNGHNPCLHRGPLSLEYYLQAMDRWHRLATDWVASKDRKDSARR